MDAPPTPNGHAPDSGAVEATSGPAPARRRPTPRLSYGQHLKALTQAIAPPLDLPVWATTGRARARKDQARTSLEERRRLLCALDLLNAVAMGAMSAPGTPFHVLTEPPGTFVMGMPPWVTVPAILVPVYLITHLEIGARLRSTGAEKTTTQPETRPRAA